MSVLNLYLMLWAVQQPPKVWHWGGGHPTVTSAKGSMKVGWPSGKVSVGWTLNLPIIELRVVLWSLRTALREVSVGCSWLCDPPPGTQPTLILGAPPADMKVEIVLVMVILGARPLLGQQHWLGDWAPFLKIVWLHSLHDFWCFQRILSHFERFLGKKLHHFLHFQPQNETRQLGEALFVYSLFHLNNCVTLWSSIVSLEELSTGPGKIPINLCWNTHLSHQLCLLQCILGCLSWLYLLSCLLFWSNSETRTNSNENEPITCFGIPCREENQLHCWFEDLYRMSLGVHKITCRPQKRHHFDH